MQSPARTHRHGCTEAMLGPDRCGCDSMVTVFLAWSCDTSSYICSTLSSVRFWLCPTTNLD